MLFNDTFRKATVSLFGYEVRSNKVSSDLFISN